MSTPRSIECVAGQDFHKNFHREEDSVGSTRKGVLSFIPGCYSRYQPGITVGNNSSVREDAEWRGAWSPGGLWTALDPSVAALQPLSWCCTRQ